MNYDQNPNLYGSQQRQQEDAWLDDLKSLLDDESAAASYGSTPNPHSFQAAPAIQPQNKRQTGIQQNPYAQTNRQTGFQQNPYAQTNRQTGFQQSPYGQNNDPLGFQQSSASAGFGQFPGQNYPPQNAGYSMSDYQMPAYSNGQQRDYPDYDNMPDPDLVPRKKPVASVIVLSIIVLMELAAIAAVAMDWIRWMG